MSPPRVALVGARRVRQGLGPFVARDLLAAGAELAGVAGTTAASVAAARRELRDALGVDAPGHTDVDALLAHEKPDALAILSPAETHEPCLRAAAAAGVHVLCEKPLVWGGEDLRASARACVEAFRARGLLLAENCQWPYALPAFRALHPDVAAQPRRLAMRLSPDGAGERVLGDCLPHPLSVLQALAPHSEPHLERIRVRGRAAEPAELRVSFDFAAGAVRIETEVELVQTRATPRPAALVLDGRRAERRVKLPEYAMEFAEGTRAVPLPDPLTARIAAFVADLRAVLAGGAAPDPAPLLARMALLADLRAAWRRQVDGAAA